MTAVIGHIGKPERRLFSGLNYDSRRSGSKMTLGVQVLEVLRTNFTAGNSEYSSDVIRHLDGRPEVVRRLQDKLAEVSNLTEDDLGFEIPDAGAFDVVRKMVPDVARQSKDSDRLEIAPDEGGYLDLILMRGLETVSVSTSGHDDIDVRWIPSSGPMTRLSASSPQAAVRALFSAPPKRGK